MEAIQSNVDIVATTEKDVKVETEVAHKPFVTAERRSTPTPYALKPSFTSQKRLSTLARRPSLCIQQTVSAGNNLPFRTPTTAAYS
jgi:hypothetical protein